MSAVEVKYGRWAVAHATRTVYEHDKGITLMSRMVYESDNGVEGYCYRLGEFGTWVGPYASERAALDAAAEAP